MTNTTHYDDIVAYTTKDGSLIRELMHPDQHACHNQSLAEASLSPDMESQLHQHSITEEIYHITQGSGVMTLGNDNFPVSEGDTICISPGTAHKIKNTGTIDLKILCCCTPAYSHEDTIIVSEQTNNFQS